MGRPDADVLIVGGGVIGLACAHYLLQAGRSVHVIDKSRAGGATSHGNCGTITPSHAPPLAAPGVIGKALKWMWRPDAPLYVKPRLDFALAAWLLRFTARCNRRDWLQSAHAKGELLAASRRLLEDLVRNEGLDCEFETRGLNYIYRNPRVMDLDRAQLAGLAELGIESAVWDAGQLAAAEPALLPGLAGAVHFPGDAHLRPDRYTAELARRVREQGGVIEENVAALGFHASQDRIDSVQCGSGKRRAREVLITAGPWSPGLLEMLDLPLPIQPGKGYSITYDRPTLAPAIPMVLREHSVCVTAWDSGFRLGSTMEFSGYDDSLNAVRLAALERAASDYLHHPTGPRRQEQWFGWRPMTPDDLPILGRAPRHRNLWLATGHGMMGMGMSAITGKLLSELISGSQASIDPHSFRAERFK